MALKDDLIRGAQIASNPFRRQWLALTRAHNPGPKVLANSIPKSGTHLLMRCLDLFPGMVNYHSGLFIFGLGQTGLAGKQNALRRMGGGCHVMAHLPYAPEAGQTLAGYGFTTVLMVRDPRDVAVSLYKFALRKRRHPLRPYFASLPNDHTRLKMAIIGNLDVAYGGIGPRFRSYMPWAEHGSFLLTFEDLVGEKGVAITSASSRPSTSWPNTLAYRSPRRRAATWPPTSSTPTAAPSAKELSATGATSSPRNTRPSSRSTPATC